MRRTGLLTLCLAILAARPVPAQITAELFATGLDLPIYVTAAPGDTERLFVVQWEGQVRILENGVLLPRPFLDIEDIVFWDDFERGLLGMTFDPDYDTNGWFYLYFINRSGLVGSSVIRRYTVSSDPDSADRATQHPVFTLPQIGGDHNGGHIEFGPDGYLWLGLGDGNNVPGTTVPQELDNLFGKMIRIDPYGDDFPADPTNNYAIPPTNPLVADSTASPEIWSWGLRNPYRFCFDEAAADLYIADVGQGFWEEIDWAPASSAGGENWGWPFKEGTSCFNPPEDCDPGGLTDPVHEYPHPDGFAVTGGRVYRGAAIPSMQGHYFFGDFITDRTWTLRIENGQAVEVTEWTAALNAGPVETIDNIVAYGKDALGELYICDLYHGEIFKIVPDPAVAAPIAGGPLSLSAPYPNPFSRRVEMRFAIDRPSPLEVGVYTVAGRLVRRIRAGRAAAGSGSIAWDGRDARGARAPAGVYLLRAVTPEGAASRSVTLLR